MLCLSGFVLYSRWVPLFFLIAISVNFLDLFRELHDSLLQKSKKKKKPTSSIKNITALDFIK